MFVEFNKRLICQDITKKKINPNVIVVFKFSFNTNSSYIILAPPTTPTWPAASFYPFRQHLTSKLKALSTSSFY